MNRSTKKLCDFLRSLADRVEEYGAKNGMVEYVVESIRDDEEMSKFPNVRIDTPGKGRYISIRWIYENDPYKEK